MSAAGAGNPGYVAVVLTLYLDLPDTPLRPSPLDQSLANKLHQQAVPLALVESACCSLLCAGSPDLPNFLHFRRFGRSPIFCR